MAMRRAAAPDLLQLLDHDSDSEDQLDSESEDEDHLEVQENDDDDDNHSDDALPPIANIPIIEESFVGKDGITRWQRNPPVQGRHRLANIIRQREGPTAAARTTTIIDTFALMFPDVIIRLVMRTTNKYAANYIVQRPDGWYANRWKEIDIDETKAFIGCLLFIGVMKSRHENYESLWSNELGRQPLRATMSLSRFKLILKFIRFDDLETRVARRQRDKMAAIRQVWDLFATRCRTFYNVGTDCTVDEQLVGFRGRCPFRMYIPSKPHRYGIKIWSLVDSHSCYVYNCQVYLGKEGNLPEIGQGKRVVEQLAQPIFGSGRNITTDNFFTSVPLAESLWGGKLTLTGTLRSNKKEIPVEFKSNPRRAINSSLFGFCRNMTLCSYKPKQNKSVILLSTQHNTIEVSERDDRKPQIILDYNVCKGAVDTVDQMVAGYSCSRATRRWPLKLFFHILDIAALNSYIIWMKNYPAWNGQIKYKRRLFLVELASALMRPHIEKRSAIPQLQLGVRAAMRNVGVDRAADDNATRGRCILCNNRNQVKVRCMRCNAFICSAHSQRGAVCNNCNE